MSNSIMEFGQNKEFFIEILSTEREKLNQIIIDNDLDVSCKEVIYQSTVVDEILTKLRMFD